MKRLLSGFVIVALSASIMGCDSDKPQNTGTPLPPSKEVKSKVGKGHLVADEMPPPPTR